MAKWTVGHGIDNYIRSLNTLLADTDEVIKETIRPGARLMTDKIDAAIDNIPIRSYNQGDGMVYGITASQKAGLKESLGIAQLRKDGSFVNVKIGFDGYNSTRTKKYPKGQANAMIARALESGTSFRARHPFISQSVRACRKATEEAMKKQLDIEIKKRIH